MADDKVVVTKPCPPKTGTLSVSRESLLQMAEEIDRHLRFQLLPYWERVADIVFGGFLTHVDGNGVRTSETSKTALSQVRVIYAMSAAHLAGLGNGRCKELALHGLKFLIDHFWDNEHGGWFEVCERDGSVQNDRKTVYPHLLAIYALSYCAQATGDPRAREYALKTYEVLLQKAGDRRYGGLRELFYRDWSPLPDGPDCGDRKSFDIHMHWMEALTALYSLTQDPVHRRELIGAIELIFDHMLRPDTGAGIAQFTLAWKPLPQKFPLVRWGMDRGRQRELDNTSYGHNIEFVHLLHWAIRVLGAESTELGSRAKAVCEKIVDHSARHGVDWDLGGLFLEGPGSDKFGPSEDGAKEFWQQAEALIGFLDGALWFKDDRSFAAAQQVWRFVRDKFIDPNVGEWWPYLTREGVLPGPQWHYFSNHCKICYHTLRAALEASRLLRELAFLID